MSEVNPSPVSPNENEADEPVQGELGHSELGHGEIDYEEKDVRFGVIIGSILGLIGLTVVAMLASVWLLDSLEVRSVRLESTPVPLLELRPTPPPPRLQPNPIDAVTAEEELAIWLAHESAILGSYAWIDEDAGTVRIPITRAMELYVEQVSTE